MEYEWKAVIFDMDGVLIDSEPKHTQAMLQLASYYHIPLTEDYIYQNFIGCSLAHVLSHIKKKFHLFHSVLSMTGTLRRISRRIYEQGGYPPVPFVVDLVHHLKAHGLRLAIASSSPMEWILHTVTDLHLEGCFDALVSGTMVAHSKPAPDIFLLAAEKLKVSPCECMVIEDSTNGVKAAQNGNIPCIGYENPHSGSQDLYGACVIVQSFEGLDWDFLQREFRDAWGYPNTIATTDRLYLRELIPEDVPALMNLYGEDGLTDALEDLPSSPEDLGMSDASQCKKLYGFYGYGQWGVFLRDSNEFVGACGLRNSNLKEVSGLELSYLIRKNFRRQGYGTEAMRAILSFARTSLEENTFFALVHPENHISIAFTEHLGLLYQNTVTQQNKTLLLYVLDPSLRKQQAAHQAKDKLKNQGENYRPRYQERVH